MTVTMMHAALRQLTLDDLERIRHGEILQNFEKDIKVLLEKLETKKNLLLFYPYEYRFSDNQHPSDGVSILKEALQQSFLSAFCYRRKHLPQFETFLTTVFYNDFVLFRIKENRLYLMDVVPGDQCPTFEHLRNYDWM